MFYSYIPVCGNMELFRRLCFNPPLYIGQEEIVYYEDYTSGERYLKNRIECLFGGKEDKLVFHLKDDSWIKVVANRRRIGIYFNIKQSYTRKAFMEFVRGNE